MDDPIVNVGQQEEQPEQQQDSNSQEVAKEEDDIAKTVAAAISAALADPTPSKDDEEQEEPTETEEPEPTETSFVDSEGDDEEGEDGNEQEDVSKTNSLAMTASDDKTHLRLDTVININNSSNISGEEKKEDDHMPEEVYEDNNKEPLEDALTDADSSEIKEDAAASVEDADINEKPSAVENTTESCPTDERALEDVTKDEKPEIIKGDESPESVHGGDALDTTSPTPTTASKEEVNADVPTEEFKSENTKAPKEPAVEEKTEEPAEETNAVVEAAEEITNTPEFSSKVNITDDHPEPHENADAAPKAALEPKVSSEDPPAVEETADISQQTEEGKKEPTTVDAPASLNIEDQIMETKTEEPVAATSGENEEPKAQHVQQPSDDSDAAVSANGENTKNNANDDDDDDATPAMTASVDSDRPSGEAQVTTRLTSLSEVTAGEKSTTKSVQFAEDTIISKKDSGGIVVSSRGATSRSKRRVLFSCGVPLCGKMEDVDECYEKVEQALGDFKSPKNEASTDSKTPVQEEAKETPEDQKETTGATEKEATDNPVEKKDNENLVISCDDEAAPTAVVANDKEDSIEEEKGKTTDALTEMKPTDLEIQEHRVNSFDIQEGFTCTAVFTCGILGTDQMKAVAPEEPEVIKMTMSQDLIMEARETTEREVEARQQEGDLAVLGFPEPPIPNLVLPPPPEKQDEVSPQEEAQVETEVTGSKTEPPVEEKIAEEKASEEKTIEAEPQKDQPTEQQLEVEAKVPGEQPQDNEKKEEKPGKDEVTGDQIEDTDVAEEKPSDKDVTQEQPAEKHVALDVDSASASQPEATQAPADILNEPRNETSDVEEETKIGSTSDSLAEPTPDAPPVASTTENDSKIAPTIQEQPAAATFLLLAPIKGVIVDEAASKAQQEAYACGCTIL